MRSFEVRFTHLTGLSGSTEERECEATVTVEFHRDGTLNDWPETCPECGDHLGPTILERIIQQARADLNDLREWEQSRSRY